MPINTAPINAGTTPAIEPGSVGNPSDTAASRNNSSPGGSFGTHLQQAAGNAPDNATADNAQANDTSSGSQSTGAAGTTAPQAPAGSTPTAATSIHDTTHDSSDGPDQSPSTPAATPAPPTSGTTTAPGSAAANGLATLKDTGLPSGKTSSTAGSTPGGAQVGSTGKSGTTTGRSVPQRLTLVGRATQHALVAGGSAAAHQATTSASPTSTAATTTSTSNETGAAGQTTPSAGQQVVQSAAQSAATQVTLVTATVAAATTKVEPAGGSTGGEQTSAASGLNSGALAALGTVGVAESGLPANSSLGHDSTHFASTAGVTSPGHISLEAATTGEGNWSTTIVAPQQAAAESEGVATTAASIVAATVAVATSTTEEKTDSTATAGADSDTGPTTGTATTSSITTASQPTTGTATPTLGAGTPVAGNSSASSPTGGSDGNPIASGVDSVRFVQRVARAFQTMGSNGGLIRLRLSPPELGSVRLEVSVKNGVLTAHAQTETAQARDALIDNLPALRARLAEQNIQVDQFEVDLFDSSSGGTSNQSQGNGDSSQGFTPTAARFASRSTTPVTAVAPPSGAEVVGVVDGGLNVVI